MYYIKKILISGQNEDGEKVISTLDLAPGLNIIYGPSNTGKTLVSDSTICGIPVPACSIPTALP